MGDVNLTEFRATVLFYGQNKDGSAPKDALTPKEFIREVKDRQLRNQWNEVRTMQFVRAAFRAEAMTWFDEWLPGTVTAANYTLLCEDSPHTSFHTSTDGTR